MQRLRPAAHRHAWIAILVVLAMALVPTLARALAHSQGEGTQWVEVCTSQGMKLVAVTEHDGPAAPGEAPPLSHLEHCPFCTLGQGWAPLPVRAFELAPLAVAGTPVPERFLQAPRTAHAWRTACPRGPPALG